jgi:hypothetical protein
LAGLAQQSCVGPVHAAGEAVGVVWHSGPTQAPPWQEYLQDAAAPHCPHALHVSTPVVPEHCVAAGVHTGAAPQEHAPHAQVAPHVSVP